jgi:hypothetical protein
LVWERVNIEEGTLPEKKLAGEVEGEGREGKTKILLGSDEGSSCCEVRQAVTSSEGSAETDESRLSVTQVLVPLRKLCFEREGAVSSFAWLLPQVNSQLQIAQIAHAGP